MTDDRPHDLFEAAREAMAKAHAPYSRFPVGAAIRDTDGNIHAGANIEVISFPEGWCAETTAIGHMIMAGEPYRRGRRHCREARPLFALWRLPPAAGRILGARYAHPSLRRRRREEDGQDG